MIRSFLKAVAIAQSGMLGDKLALFDQCWYRRERWALREYRRLPIILTGIVGLGQAPRFRTVPSGVITISVGGWNTAVDKLPIGVSTMATSRCGRWDWDDSGPTLDRGERGLSTN